MTAILLAQVPAQAEELIIAPFPIEDGTGQLKTSAIDGLTEYLAGRLAARPGVSIVPSHDIKRLLSDQKEASYQTCKDESCQIELGKELSASHVITTRLTAVGEQCILGSFLYELRTAATRSASTVRTACKESALVEAIDRIVLELTKLQPPKLQAKPPSPKLVEDVAIAKPPKSHLAEIVWFSVSGSLLIGGVVTDVVPGSASNGKLDGADFVPVGLYALAGVAATIGVVTLLRSL